MKNLFKKYQKLTIISLSVFLHLAPAVAMIVNIPVGNNKMDIGVITTVNLIAASNKEAKKTTKRQHKNLITAKSNNDSLFGNSKPEKQARKTLIKKDILAKAKPDNGQHDKNARHLGNVHYKIGAVNNPAPSYPINAKRRGQQGKVSVCAKVNSNGQALNVSVCESSGFQSLDHAALNTIKRWKFAVNNISSAHDIYDVKVPVQFVLN